MAAGPVGRRPVGPVPVLPDAGPAEPAAMPPSSDSPGSATLERLHTLAADPASGVVVRPGVFCVRTDTADLGWTAAVAGQRRARPDERTRQRR